MRTPTDFYPTKREHSQIDQLRFILKQTREVLARTRYGYDEPALLQTLSRIDVALSEQAGDDCANCRYTQERSDKHLEQALTQRHRARNANKLAAKTEENRQLVLQENNKLRQQRNEARAEVRLLKKAIQNQGGVK